MKLQDSPQDAADCLEVQARLLKMLNEVQVDQPPRTVTSTPRGTTDTSGRRAPSSNRRENQPPPEPTADSTCNNCENTEPWGESPWCPKCGFYAKLNRVMEGVALDQEDQDKDPLDDFDFDKLFPSWLLLIALGLIMLLASSIAVRFLVTDVGARGELALAQIVIGLVAFGIAHFRAYLIAAFASSKFSAAHMFTTPIALWSEVFKLLPKHNKVVASAAWGLMAMVLAVGVIGLDFDGLFKPAEVARKPRTSPLKWVVKQLLAFANSQAETEEASGGAAAGDRSALMAGAQGGTLEDAIGDFADATGTDLLIKGHTSTGSGPASDPESEGGDGTNESGHSGSGTGEVTSAGGSSNPTGTGTNTAGGLTSSQGGSIPLSRTPANATAVSASGLAAGPLGSPAEKGPSPMVSVLEKHAALGPGRELAELVIFGYTTNAQGDLRSLLMARETGNNRARYAGRMFVESMPQAQLKQLEKELQALRVSRPAVVCPHGGNWVRPDILCKVSHKGMSSDGRIDDGRLLGYERRLPITGSR